MIEGTLGCVFHTNVYLISAVLACARGPFEHGADSFLRYANASGGGFLSLTKPLFFLFGFVFRTVATALAFAELCAVYSVKVAAAIVLGTLSLSPATGMYTFRALTEASVAAYTFLAKGGAKVARPNKALAHTFSGCFKETQAERPPLVITHTHTHTVPPALSSNSAKQQPALPGCSTDPLPVVVGVPVAQE